jgi:hypothetical protein
MKTAIIFAGLLAAFSWNGPAHAEDQDPQAVLNEARQLAQAGKYDEALAKHLWYHENAVRIQPAQSGVRLSFALAAWRDLGEKFPKAHDALVAIRDDDVKTLTDGGGSPQLFQDVAEINRVLEESPKTVSLFKELEEKRPDFAKRCYFFAEKSLAEQKEYKTCSRYIDDPMFRLDTVKTMKRLSDNRQQPPELARMQEKLFVDDLCRTISILAGADRKPEAEQLQKEALVMFDSEASAAKLRRAAEFAEKPVAN